MNVINMVKSLYNTILPKQIKQHIGEKPCDCKQCGQSFAHPSNLQIHKRTHNGEKFSECNQCAEDFICVSSLQNHERRYTTDSRKNIVGVIKLCIVYRRKTFYVQSIC